MAGIRNVAAAVAVGALAWLAAGCSRPDSVAFHIDGIWETEWKDYIGEDDVDDIRVTEMLVLEHDDASGEHGRFGQIFSGEVDFDDFEYEQAINYVARVSGTWKIVKDNNLEMSYDMESLETSTGKSDVDVDYSDAIVDLFSGNFVSALVGSAMNSNETDRANKRIDKAVARQVELFFKNYLRELNHNKKSLTDIVIDGDMMTCEVNTGWFGRDAVYDRKKVGPQAGMSQQQSARSTGYTSADEGDAPCASEDELLELPCFRGKLAGKYDIEFFYDPRTPRPTDSVQALYHYGKGKNGNLELYGSVDAGGRMNLTEYNDSGKTTGTWNVVLSQEDGRWRIRGTMTNYKGKTFSVELVN